MTTFVLVSGALFRAPEKKTSKSGKPYAFATIRTRADDNRSDFWRLTVFSESAIDVLMALSEGDHLSAQGPMQAQLYEAPDKPPRISLSLIADTVTPLRAARKERAKPATSEPKPIRRSRAAQAANGGGRELPQLRQHGGHSPDPQLDDDLPF